MGASLAVRLLVTSLRAGGAEHVAVRLANSFAGLGLDVEVVAVKGGGPYRAELDSAVSFSDLGCTHIRGSGVAIVRWLTRRPRVPTLAFGADVGLVPVAARRLGLLGARIVVREGSVPSRNNPRWAALWYPSVMRAADVVVAQSLLARNELRDLGLAEERIRVVPNPLPGAAAKGADLPREGVVLDGRPRVLAVGRLSAEKGHDRLIRAFARLRERHREARLVVLGEGPERARLEELVRHLRLQECVRLPGISADVPGWMRWSELLVVASHYEGQPNALIEAIDRAVPVLCADAYGGLRELLATCGLEDRIVADECFEAEFPDRVDRVLEDGAAAMSSAQLRLRRWMDPERVALAYLGVCGVALDEQLLAVGGQADERAAPR